MSVFYYQFKCFWHCSGVLFTYFWLLWLFFNEWALVVSWITLWGMTKVYWLDLTWLDNEADRNTVRFTINHCLFFWTFLVFGSLCLCITPKVCWSAHPHSACYAAWQTRCPPGRSDRRWSAQQNSHHQAARRLPARCMPRTWPHHRAWKQHRQPQPGHGGKKSAPCRGSGSGEDESHVPGNTFRGRCHPTAIN